MTGSFLYCATTAKAIASIALLLVLHITNADEFEYPTCGDCWCVPSDECPCPDWEPVSPYPESTIEAFEKQIPSFVYKLECNPYEEEDCDTVPPLEYVDTEDDSVCGLKYGMGNHFLRSQEEVCPIQYTMKSYASWTEAENDGAFVTHNGHCGVCSTTQDLAAYMRNPDLDEKAEKCFLTDLTHGTEAGIKCYMGYGLSYECAKLYMYGFDSKDKFCAETCIKEYIEKDGDVPNNGPPPECELSDCRKCDQLCGLYQDVFLNYVGRLYPDSGLKSNIVRGCSYYAQIVQDPCPTLSSATEA